MSSLWLIELSFCMLVASLGVVVGWWLRGRMPQSTPRKPTSDRKQIAEQALQSLHAAAETVRACVQQHIECIQTIKCELTESSGTEPAIINNAAATIIAANGLVKHQCDDIRRTLDKKKRHQRLPRCHRKSVVYVCLARSATAFVPPGAVVVGIARR